jgi:hypothetical protein
MGQKYAWRLAAVSQYPNDLTQAACGQDSPQEDFSVGIPVERQRHGTARASTIVLGGK